MKKPGRNALCPCGSGLKYKRCCEAKDISDAVENVLGTLDPDEEAEIHLHGQVYNSVLMGVWIAFHGTTGPMPDIPALEDFYQEIYGYELDPFLIDDLIFPLSPRALAQLQSAHARQEAKILDITAADVQPELRLDPDPASDS